MKTSIDRGLRALARLALGALAALPSAAQTTWHVDAAGVPPGSGSPAQPYTSIQYAIDQAGTLPGDTLLVAPGTYAELVDFSGKTLRLFSSGGAAVTTIDASSAMVPDQSTVTLASGEGPASEIAGFTLIGSFGTFSGGLYFGGCLYLEGTSPSVSDCVLKDGRADFGAGVSSRGGSPSFLRTSFLGNADFTVNSGGGAYVELGTVAFDECTFDGNQAWGQGGAGLAAQSASVHLSGCSFSAGGGYGAGQGVWLRSSTALIEDCRFESNTTLADNGGALWVGPDSVATVERSDFVGNDCDDDHTGGAIYVEGAFGGAAGDLSLRDCLIQDNFSARGGGIANFGQLSAERCTLADNTAQAFSSLDGSGGGLWTASFGGASAKLVRCVLVGNQAFPGFGGGGEGGAVFGPALLENCTVVDNSAIVAGGGACGSTLLNTIHRGNSPAAICAPSSAIYSNVEGGAPGVGNIDLDPLFWDAAGRDYHLLLGSPCIDAGNPTSPLDPDGSRSDMGAFPHEGSYAVPYCTAGSTAIGCLGLMTSAGTPSASASFGFVVGAGGLEGGRSGLVYFGFNGRQALPWGNGTSFQCVVPPLKRSQVLASGGTGGVCNGTLSLDLNAHWCSSCPKPGHNPGAGSVVQAQAWFRDPANTSNRTTSLSNALEFQVQP